MQEIDPHPSVNLNTAISTLTATTWTTAVKNFAWSCTANCLPNGYSCSRGKHGLCPLCGTAKQSVLHEVAHCPQLQSTRRWILEVCGNVVPQVTAASLPAFIMYGLHRAISNQRNVLVLRACFFAQWRAQRNAAINGHDNAVQRTWSTMNQRLRAGILRDWSRGSTPHKFNIRWQPYASHGPNGPCFHIFPSPRDGAVT